MPSPRLNSPPATPRSAPASDRIFDGQIRLLELLAEGRPKDDLLLATCQLLAENLGACSAITLLDGESGELYAAAVAELPPELQAELNSGLGDESPPARALRAGITVVVEGYVPAGSARSEGSYACYSTAIQSPSAGGATTRPLGTLNLYFEELQPSDHRVEEQLERAARLVALLIAHGAEAQPRVSTSCDGLTGLVDRTGFRQRLSEALPKVRQQEKIFAVLAVDIDHLKNINDMLGQRVGDHVLRTVARRLLHSVRREDTVARAGGDEFLLFFDSLRRQEDVSIIARKVTEALNRPYDFGGQLLFLTIRLGISVYPWDGEDPETLIRNAETALACAKEERSDHELFRLEMNSGQPSFESWVDQLRLGHDLRQALSRDQLELFYQIKVRTDSMRVCGAEALLRWRHPELGVLLPRTFLPLAEQSGMILPMEDWIMAAACAENQLWHSGGLSRMAVSVNVSPQQFRYGDLVATVENALERSHLEPQLLELEIAEDLTMHDLDISLSRFDRLRKLGVGICIDNFGLGFSSLRNLTRFSIDSLKIDRDFVRLIGGCKNGEAVVRAVISIGKSIDARVIAEGVETREQIDFLSHHGCDVLQGFYFQQPAPADEFARMLANKLY